MKYNECTEEIVEKAVKLVKEHGYNQKQAAEELNVYYRTLLKKINKKYGSLNGYKGKKNVDSKYFNIIDTEHKAYWLGFLTADGHLSKKGMLEITLAEKDYKILEEFKKDLKSEHPINYRVCKYKGGKEFGQYRISFTDQEIASDLRRYGFTNNKTFDQYIPFDYIPKDLMRHYVRGYFDGNGSAFNNGGARLNLLVGCTASIKMANDLITVLFDYDISSTYGIDRRGENKVYSVFVNRTREMQRLFKWFYEDATIYLNRKYEKFAASGQVAWRPELISAE